ncbi:unnamed protein product [Merluccius merluccius]
MSLWGQRSSGSTSLLQCQPEQKASGKGKSHGRRDSGVAQIQRDPAPDPGLAPSGREKPMHAFHWCATVDTHPPTHPRRRRRRDPALRRITLRAFTSPLS